MVKNWEKENVGNSSSSNSIAVQHLGDTVVTNLIKSTEWTTVNLVSTTDLNSSSL